MSAGPATFRHRTLAQRRSAQLRGRLRVRAATLALLFAALFPLPLLSAAPTAVVQRVIVVRSDDSLANSRAIAGMRNQPGWTIESRRMGDTVDSVAAELASADADTVIVALGAKASRYIAALQVAVPTVDCMVQGDLDVVSAAPVVPLAVPIDLQVQWMKQLLPSVRKLAILFDPAQNELTVADITRQLVAAGYVVMAEKVASPDALPPALARLSTADALLALPDTTVYAPELAKGLLLFTYRTNTPMIGLSEAWVRAGALYSLEWDYAELGRYCAALAIHQKATAKGARAPSWPALKVSVNRRAAAQLRLNWDATSLAGVTHVHD